jgi:hypothetical protein
MANRVYSIKGTFSNLKRPLLDYVTLFNFFTCNTEKKSYGTISEWEEPSCNQAAMVLGNSD